MTRGQGNNKKIYEADLASADLFFWLKYWGLSPNSSLTARASSQEARCRGGEVAGWGGEVQRRGGVVQRRGEIGGKAKYSKS